MTQEDAMVQPRMRPDEGQFELRASSVFRHLYVCSDVDMSNIRC